MHSHQLSIHQQLVFLGISKKYAQRIVKRARKLHKRGIPADDAIIRAYGTVLPRRLRRPRGRPMGMAYLHRVTDILIEEGVLGQPTAQSGRSVIEEDFLDDPAMIVVSCGGVRDLYAWP